MTLALVIAAAVFALIAFMGWVDAMVEPSDLAPWT